MYFDALWSDTDWFWRSAYFSPYVVRFDAPFIRCWMMRTLCSFIARMCFVSDLDADHVSCYPSTGYKCCLFWFFLRRMLTLLDLLLYCKLYVLFWCSLLHQMLTESDVLLIRSQTVRALFHSPILFVDGVRLRSSWRMEQMMLLHRKSGQEEDGKVSFVCLYLYVS